MILTTTPEIPGYRITDVIGLVSGLVVSAGKVSLGSGLKISMGRGGELTPYTKVLMETRALAQDRMVKEAQAKGANAIVSISFIVASVHAGAGVSVLAYGTAVKVEKNMQGAK